MLGGGEFTEKNTRSFKKSKQIIKTKYVDKVMDYLLTKTNAISPRDFTEVYSIVMEETDANDNSKDLHSYAKDLMRDFCKNKVLKKLMQSSKDSSELLAEYARLFENMKVFTHSLNKLFNYLNRFYLKNHN